MKKVGLDRRFLDLNSIGPSDSMENIEVGISPTDFAAVFYTSGSTGDPKGVIQTHRNILHNIMLRFDVHHVGPMDNLSLLASTSSSAVMNVLLALLNGAKLVHFDVRETDFLSFARWFEREKISLSMITPALFRALCERLDTSRQPFPSLRVLVFTGDTVYMRDVELYRRYFPPDCFLMNTFASTETGPIATYLIDQNTEIAAEPIPLGYVCADKEVRLLDDDGKEIGFNQIGEVVVHSSYLTPGYWRNPALNEAKFFVEADTPGPFYRTGDLALMLSDGSLVHQGREDFRIKVRGYGIDLLEVEKTLLSHPGINGAVVKVNMTKERSARLTAYFTATQVCPPTPSELRDYLREKLADHMVPSTFLQLDRIPLNANGKIDRNALPDADNRRPELTIAYVSPRNQLEMMLVEIWERVLDVRPIGVHDHFFELGGDSLAASRVVSSIIRRFQLEIQLKSLLESPTVAAMAALISAHHRTGDVKTLAKVLNELESLSEEDAKQLLNEQRREETKQ